MKNHHLFFALASLFFCSECLWAQTIWTGPTITVTRSDNVDWTLEANQDNITPNVWITRAHPGGGIFNFVSETQFSRSSSPADTEWAMGTSADIGRLTFKNWKAAVGQVVQIENKNMVLHLITDDIYIDIKFTHWDEGNGNPNLVNNTGAFTYIRSTDHTLAVPDFESVNKIHACPNPVGDYVQVSGLPNTMSYQLYDVLGIEIDKGLIINNQKMSTQHLTNGLFFLKLENGTIIKLIKE